MNINKILTSRFRYLFPLALIATSSVISISAQKPTLTKKEALILEFRRLTGADRVNMNINVTTDEVRDELSALVEKDPDLNEAQKAELRKAASEAYATVEKVGKDFFANRDQLNTISGQGIFGLYDAMFSEEELAEVTAFYRTPVGKKTAAFLPTLSAKAQDAFIAVVLPKFRELVMPVASAETEKLKQKISVIKKKSSSNE